MPHPKATIPEVQKFLTEFFAYLDHDRTRSDAETEAKKVRADGTILYEMTEDVWINKFEDEGSAIYRALQKSQYGYVCQYLLSLWTREYSNHAQSTEWQLLAGH